MRVPPGANNARSVFSIFEARREQPSPPLPFAPPQQVLLQQQQQQLLQQGQQQQQAQGMGGGAFGGQGAQAGAEEPQLSPEQQQQVLVRFQHQHLTCISCDALGIVLSGVMLLLKPSARRVPGFFVCGSVPPIGGYRWCSLGRLSREMWRCPH